MAHFALSYDIWEEKFSVVKIGDRPESRRASQSHLTAQQTQNWCLDNLAIDRSALPADRPFFVQLDLRAEDPHDQLGIVGEPGINITRLIEVFSRPPKVGRPLVAAERAVPSGRSEEGGPGVTLRTRLALVFVAATLVPLGATLWLTSLLLNESLRPADQLGDLSRALEKTGHAYYKLACERLRADALAGRPAQQTFREGSLPPAEQEFGKATRRNALLGLATAVRSFCI